MHKHFDSFAYALTLTAIACFGLGCNVRMADIGPEDDKTTRILVTDGHVGTGDVLPFRTESPEMRGIFLFPRSRRLTFGADLQFIFLGETGGVSHLGNGEVRHQIGMKFMAKDPCNLLYAMVRREPDGMSALYVSTKLNPGQSTSAECADRGYVSLAGPIRLGHLNYGDDHVISAEWDMDSMSVRISYDWVPRVEVPIDDDTLSQLGIDTGVRTDNMMAEFAAEQF